MECQYTQPGKCLYTTIRCLKDAQYVETCHTRKQKKSEEVYIGIIQNNKLPINALTNKLESALKNKYE